MECMVRLISSPPEPGEYAVVNQVSGLHKVRNIAETVASVGDTFGYGVKIQRVENPRIEAEIHPLEAVAERLPNDFGFMPKVSLEKAVTRMFELLRTPEISERIAQKAHVIMPKTWWSGDKKESGTLEVYEPGTREDKGYKPVFHTGVKSEEILNPKH